MISNTDHFHRFEHEGWQRVAERYEILEAIKNQIEDSVSAYAKDDGFVIPFTSHVIAVRAL